MMEIALLENLQREDLTIVEEAIAYKSLIEELNLTQEELSQKLGKSRSHIANTMRLLSLPEEIINLINNGELSMGHGRALLGLNNQDDTLLVARKIVSNNLNVREVEKLIAELNGKEVKRKTKKAKKDPFLKEYENNLREKLGTKVTIQRNDKKGKIEIEFYSDDELNQLIKLLER